MLLNNGQLNSIAALVADEAKAYARTHSDEYARFLASLDQQKRDENASAAPACRNGAKEVA
jgi:hypothetical protein